MSTARPVTPVQCLDGPRHTLGEGPFWSSAGQLLWVDIRRGEVWAARGGSTPQRLHVMEPPVSSVSAAAGGRWIVTGRDALWVLEPGSAATELVRLPGEPAQHRCNEAKVDPWGNLWFGTMNEADEAPTGALWRLSREGELDKVLEGVAIPNTLAWDPSRGVLYFGDSARGEIHAFDAGDGEAALRGQRAFLPRGAAPGVPDGSALDDEGCLWNARWDGACVVRVSPQGKVVQQVSLPARRPTSCAFGAGRELYVTTALTDHDPAGADGRVLRVAVAAGGAPGCAYAGPTRADDVRVGNLSPTLRWRDS